LQQFIIQNLVHVAAIFTLVCFLFRNQIKLRIFAVLGDALAATYYFTAFDVPLWNSMAWNILNVLINSVMIVLILRDGRAFEMSEDEMHLFRQLPSLSPGQFRKLLKIGKWHKDGAAVVLTQEGEALDHLHYVLQGPLQLAKAGRVTNVEPRLFIGELAFLRKRPATATVSAGEGAHYISWAHEELKKLLDKDPDLNNVLQQILGRDMAEKMANS
jgi:CRP-like cAMP-binding protein